MGGLGELAWAAGTHAAAPLPAHPGELAWAAGTHAAAPLPAHPALSYCGLGAAVLAWGTYTLPMKSQAVVSRQLHFLLFALYQSAGIASSSLLLLASGVCPWTWTWWAAASACAWVPANMCAFLCVGDIGIALGQSIWSGLVALVSFLWGQLYFEAGMNEPALGGAGIALLAVGVGALGLISGGALNEEEVEEGERRRGGKGQQGEELLLGELPQQGLLRWRRARGLLLAVTVGLLAGSTMVPLRLAPDVPFHDGVRAVAFDVGFSAGVLAVTLLIAGAFVADCVWRRRVAPPPLELRACFGPAFLSGVLWNVGNVGSIWAVLPPLGLTAGYPLTMCCLLVSGGVGVAVYGELRGRRAIGAFFGAATVVLIGASLLGVYGSAA